MASHSDYWQNLEHLELVLLRVVRTGYIKASDFRSLFKIPISMWTYMKRIGRFDDFLVRLNETGEHVIMQADFESLLHKGIARPGALAVYGGVIPDSVTPSTYTHYMCPYEVIILFNDMKQKYNLDTAKMVVEGDEKRGKRETWVEITEDHPLYDQAKDHIDFDL